MKFGTWFKITLAIAVGIVVADVLKFFAFAVVSGLMVFVTMLFAG